MGLEIWDAYRTHQAQKKLWAVCPNTAYVTDPAKGYSSHTRGCAVDVTLVDTLIYCLPTVTHTACTTDWTRWSAAIWSARQANFSEAVRPI